MTVPMQKVEGSSQFSRSHESPAQACFLTPGAASPSAHRAATRCAARWRGQRVLDGVLGAAAITADRAGELDESDSVGGNELFIRKVVSNAARREVREGCNAQAAQMDRDTLVV
jgi:hypothetical protein